MRTTHPRASWLGVLLLGFALTVGCGSRQDEPLVASSAQQASYAARYPDELKTAVEDFNKREEEANAVLSEVPTYVDALDNPDWNQVIEVVDAATEAGHSQAYAERIREVRHVHTFFEEEKEEINRHTAGAAQYAATQAGCSAQVGGAVSSALKKTVDKQLEKRLRERNEAHLLVVRYSDSLGEKNAETLGQQADHLSYASYITRVELTEIKRRLDKMVEEASEVQKTADSFIADEEAFQNEPNRKDQEKESSAARIKFMKEAKARVASSAEEAKKAAEQMEQRIEKLQKDFDYIVGALRSNMQQRASK